jgi:hypothetical protein
MSNISKNQNRNKITKSLQKDAKGRPTLIRAEIQMKVYIQTCGKIRPLKYDFARNVKIIIID